VVTSFETIEHHDRHEEMIGEIKRVLRPGGLLILSSPNRAVYSDEPGYANPFHVKELYFDELEELLSRHFRHVRIYGQRVHVGSFVFGLDVLSGIWTCCSRQVPTEVRALHVRTPAYEILSTLCLLLGPAAALPSVSRHRVCGK
jgi:SAM-dependent methyltransferase